MVHRQTTSELRAIFKRNPLYPIVQVDEGNDSLALASKLLESQVEIIQLRAKLLKEEEYIAISRKIIELRNKWALRYQSTLIIINDLPQVCLKAEADGVHLGQEDINPITARKILGPQSIIGLSTHNLSQVLSAQSEAVNYLGFGPLFPSLSKSGHAPVLGVERLEAATQKSELPIVAIGGITLNNSADVLRAGASALAVIRDLQISEDPIRRARAYRTR